HNHEIYPDTRKFSSNMHKLDQNKLGMIEVLHDNGLRTKDIYIILASILLRTLQNNENITASIATKTAYNDKCDQDSLFIQAIF
ncbi:2966_t:CDS:2, partial [Racocetra persica]